MRLYSTVMGRVQRILRIYIPLNVGSCLLSYFILLLLRVPVSFTAMSAKLYCASDVMVPLVVLFYEINAKNDKGNDHQQGNTASNEITAGIQHYFLF